MPMYLVEHDGKKFKVDAPDPETAADALQEHTGSKKKPDAAGFSYLDAEGITKALKDPQGMIRGAARGVPILGGALNKIDAATNGALAPVLNPLFDEKDQLQEKTFGERYAHSLKDQNSRDKAYHEEHPVADTLSEIVGGVASTGAAAATGTGAALMGLTGRTLPQMVARGGVSGAIENAADAAVRGEDPAKAGLTGGVVGAVSPVVGRVVNAVSQPVQNAIRGARNPAVEAERRVASAMDRDMTAGDRGLSPQEFVGARAEGTPVNLMDMGGTTTRALARSAANTSPEGRAELNRAIDERFESQSPRLANWLQHTFHFPNADAQQQALDTVARTVNRPAYARAYRDGDRDIMSPELDRLMGSPAVVEAMRKASVSGKDRAITQGVGAMRQGVTVENGLVTFTPGKNGAPTYPNLAFWDATKRELDDATNAAMRAGRGEEASTLTNLTRTLREELDNQVPSYQAARAGAAQFFGAENAIEAGQNFVGASQKFGIPATRRALANMSPNERQLFQDGYASRLIETIEKNPDRRTVLNKIQQSPAAREEIRVALGPQRAAEVEARLRVEGVMDLARAAVQGNSTTARQLVELGLAGGVNFTEGGGHLSTDPQAVMHAALMYGAARGHRVIDDRVAREVARLLTSNNVGQLQRGIRIMSRNQNMLGAIRNADAGLAAIAARGATPGVTDAVSGGPQ